jgi:3-hydroxymyristoyl/3-hydroxydecanoyl-(acyl carrier protein) dehydratase
MRDEISPGHPALAGHFPGDPIVPGVVILHRVCQAVTGIHAAAITAVPAVKFHAPLRPAERFEVALAPARGRSVDFRVLRGETLIAAGTVQVGRSEARPEPQTNADDHR